MTLHYSLCVAINTDADDFDARWMEPFEAALEKARIGCARDAG